jgi:hypothetical protein
VIDINKKLKDSIVMTTSTLSKKISYQVYLETNCKPIEGSFYPVYLRINFNGTSLKTKGLVLSNENYYWNDKVLSQFNEYDKNVNFSNLKPEDFRFTAEFYKNIIRHEYDRCSDKSAYTLKGLASRSDFFLQQLDEMVCRQLNAMLILEAPGFDTKTTFDEIINDIQLIRVLCAIEYRLSPITKRLIEFYILISLYFDSNYSIKYNSALKRRFYHFLIEDGKESFSQFVIDYLSGSEKLSFDHKENYHYLELSELMQAFVPSRRYEWTYISYMNNYLSSEFKFNKKNG